MQHGDRQSGQNFGHLEFGADDSRSGQNVFVGRIERREDARVLPKIGGYGERVVQQPVEMPAEDRDDAALGVTSRESDDVALESALHF